MAKNKKEVKPEVLKQVLSYGEKAAGVSFNPSNDQLVDTLKRSYAAIIDVLDIVRAESPNAEQKRLASEAISHAQTAQMWAVKTVTWKE